MVDLVKIFSRFSIDAKLEHIDFVLFDVMDTAVSTADGTAIRPVIDFHSWLARQGAKTFWTSADTKDARAALKRIGIDADVHNPMLLLRQQAAYAAVNDSFLPVMDAGAWLNPHDVKTGKPFLERRDYLRLEKAFA